MGDPVVEGGRRWRVLWVHHEAEELRVQDRAPIPRETAPLSFDLLASGRVPPNRAATRKGKPAAGRQMLRRLLESPIKVTPPLGAQRQRVAQEASWGGESGSRKKMAVAGAQVRSRGSCEYEPP